MKSFSKDVLLWWSFLYLKLECEGWDISSLCRPFVTANFQFLSMIQWMSGPTNNLRKRQAHLHHNNHSGYHCTGGGQWGTWGTSTSLHAAWDEKSLQWGEVIHRARAVCQNLIPLPSWSVRAPRKIALGVWTKVENPTWTSNVSTAS